MSLAEGNCVPCHGGVARIESEALGGWTPQVPEWEVVDGHHLSRDYRFADFRGALAFVNAVGELAEAEGHHPDLYLGWGKATVKIWTHAVDGLTANDFILAAKIDRLHQ